MGKEIPFRPHVRVLVRSKIQTPIGQRAPRVPRFEYSLGFTHSVSTDGRRIFVLLDGARAPVGFPLLDVRMVEE